MDNSTEQVSVDSLAEDILARAVAIDVGEDAGAMCLRTPHPSQAGKRVSALWSMSAHPDDLGTGGPAGR